MKKNDALYYILNFGRQEEKTLLQDGKLTEAYQIEYARNSLVYFLNENPVKKVRDRINAMTSYKVDQNGIWRYNSIYFVMDELTRNLLLKLQERF